MRKLGFLTGLLVIVVVLTACGGNANGANVGKSSSNEGGSKQASTQQPATSATNEEPSKTSIDKLSISFVPSRDPQEIITATEPLKDLLKAELDSLGFEVGEINIMVGTNYEAVGEALSAGTTDVGLIPGGTYVLYDDGAEVILTATRAGLSSDSDNPVDWNNNEPTTGTTSQASTYRAILIAGPSEKGKALAEKVNNGEQLTYEDLDGAVWNVMSTSSPAGYIYPALWLKENYGKTITDLSQVVQADSYANAFARLAAGQTDVLVTYADARRDYEQKWTSEYNRTATIWEETDLLGVMPAIYNDTISVSKNSPIMTEELKQALQTAFIAIGNSPAGKEVISIYSHEGYQIAKAEDYDNERKAQQLVQQLK